MPPTRLAPTLAWIREQAEKVACPDCDQPIGETCVAADGQPLGKAPAHTGRIKAAGVELPRVERHELTGWPQRRNRDAMLVAGRAAYNAAVRQAARQQRIRELRIDRRLGDLDEAGRAELVDLDATAAAEAAAVAPDELEREQHWRRGPGGLRA